MGSSLLLLALLAMLGGTPTDGFEELKNDTETPATQEGGESVGNQKKDHSPCNDVGEPFFVTPYIDSGNIKVGKNKARVKANELTKYGRGYSAFITVNKEYESNLYFWYVETKNRKKRSTAPLVMWLAGGPGVSSLAGLFTGNGPFAVKKEGDKYSVFGRKVTWTEKFNMLYVDQPVGTGFSFTKDNEGYAEDEEMVANDMYEFIKQFFKLFPYRMKNQFYIAGESYAGKYIPAIVKKMHDMNQGKDKDDKIPLNGVAIGSGNTDPIHEYYWSDFMFNAGLLDEHGRDEIAKKAENTRNYVKEKKWREAVLTTRDLFETYRDITGLEFYNYLYQDLPKSLGYFFHYIEYDYVRKILHVGDLPYSIYNKEVQIDMIDDIAQSQAPNMKLLLDEGYKVLLYNGNLDAFIPFHGTERYLRALTWNGRSKYEKAKRKIWKVGGEVAGYAKEVLKLRQVLVRNAGHGVCTDQPAWAYDMITRFVYNKPFGNLPGRNSSG